jgi:hypothetical protein
MICTCGYCLFTFESQTLPETCPDCGKGPVRPATTTEIQQYNLDREETMHHVDFAAMLEELEFR